MVPRLRETSTRRLELELWSNRPPAPAGIVATLRTGPGGSPWVADVLGVGATMLGNFSLRAWMMSRPRQAQRGLGQISHAVGSGT